MGRKTAPPVIEQSLISKANLKKLALMQDTLHQLSNSMVYDTVAAVRKKSCYDFIPKFVAALKTDNSFYFPFDSFESISKLYPPDSTFRIFTWQINFTVPFQIPAKYSKTGRDTVLQKPVIRYYGVIQMRSKQLKMFPLYDATDTLAYGSQQILGPGNWCGQLYYNIIQKSAGGKNYYTMFGFKQVDYLTRRKIIDVLTFDNGKPQFGARIFDFNFDDSVTAKPIDTLSRFFIEYNTEASTGPELRPRIGTDSFRPRFFHQR